MLRDYYRDIILLVKEQLNHLILDKIDEDARISIRLRPVDRAIEE
jgi:hypothetical protein